jgi:hypothetical protein
MIKLKSVVPNASPPVSAVPMAAAWTKKIIKNVLRPA